MVATRKLVTAEDLDSLTPDERAKVFDEHLVTDLNELPAQLRAQVEKTARHLAADLPTTPAG